MLIGGLWAAGILSMALMGIASAQPYHIRVANNTNLRASYSLESAVLASARAGSTLEVVGRHNRWLKIDRNNRTYWMASWVTHTRVDSERTASAANIDNCCFENRQCQTDQEWIAGYWAYQRNECPVSQPVTAGTAPISTSASGAIDNCCFVNRQCSANDEWVAGYNAFRYDSTCQNTPPERQSPTQSSGQFTCQSPRQSHAVPLFGPDDFRNKLGCALDLLKSKAGGWYWYGFTISGIGKIQSREGSRVSVNSRTGVVRWGIDRARYSDLASLAATMVHEACHVHRRRAGLESGGVDGEIDCTQKEIKALDALHPNHPKRASEQRLVDTIRDNPDARWWGRH